MMPVWTQTDYTNTTATYEVHCRNGLFLGTVLSEMVDHCPSFYGEPVVEYRVTPVEGAEAVFGNSEDANKHLLNPNKETL